MTESGCPFAKSIIDEGTRKLSGLSVTRCFPIESRNGTRCVARHTRGRRMTSNDLGITGRGCWVCICSPDIRRHVSPRDSTRKLRGRSVTRWNHFARSYTSGRTRQPCGHSVTRCDISARSRAGTLSTSTYGAVYSRRGRRKVRRRRFAGRRGCWTMRTWSDFPRSASTLRPR